MTWTLILAFLRKNWKTCVAVAIIGGIVVGVASLYAAWQLERAANVKLKAQLYVAENYQRITQRNLEACLDANAAWDAQADAWGAAVSRLEEEAAAYRTRLESERERRLAALRRTEELEAEVSSQITSTDCNEAVSQLITALGWAQP